MVYGEQFNGELSAVQLKVENKDLKDFKVINKRKNHEFLQYKISRGSPSSAAVISARWASLLACLLPCKAA
jgi:hypothetical protein